MYATKSLKALHFQEARLAVSIFYKLAFAGSTSSLYTQQQGQRSIYSSYSLHLKSSFPPYYLPIQAFYLPVQTYLLTQITLEIVCVSHSGNISGSRACVPLSSVSQAHQTLPTGQFFCLSKSTSQSQTFLTAQCVVFSFLILHPQEDICHPGEDACIELVPVLHIGPLVNLGNLQSDS